MMEILPSHSHMLLHICIIMTMLLVNCHAGVTAYFGWGRASNNSFMGGLIIGSPIIVLLARFSWLKLKSLTIGSSRGLWISPGPKFTLKIFWMKMTEVQPCSWMGIHLSGNQQTKIFEWVSTYLAISKPKILAFLVKKEKNKLNDKWSGWKII